MGRIEAKHQTLFARVPLSLAYEDGVWPHVHALYNALATVCDLKLRSGYGSRRQLMTLAGMTRTDQFYPAREWLIERGYLEVEVGGGRETSTYHLLDRSFEGITQAARHVPAGLETRVGDLFIRVPLTLAYEEGIRPNYHAFYNAVAAAVNFQTRQGEATWDFLREASGLANIRTLRRARDWLAQRGYLSYKLGGGRTPNRYDLRIDSAATLAHVVATQTIEGVEDAARQEQLGAFLHSGTDRHTQPGAFLHGDALRDSQPGAFLHREADPPPQPGAYLDRGAETGPQPDADMHSQPGAEPDHQGDADARGQAGAETRDSLEPLLPMSITRLAGRVIENFSTEGAVAARLSEGVQRFGEEVVVRALEALEEAIHKGVEVKAPGAYVVGIAERLAREQNAYRQRVADRLLRAAHRPSEVGAEVTPSWWDNHASKEAKQLMQWLFANREEDESVRVAAVEEFLREQGSGCQE